MKHSGICNIHRVLQEARGLLVAIGAMIPEDVSEMSFRFARQRRSTLAATSRC